MFEIVAVYSFEVPVYVCLFFSIVYMNETTCISFFVCMFDVSPLLV